MNRDFYEFEFDESVDDLANVKLPSPTLLDYYERQNERIIFWNTTIDDCFTEVYHDIWKWNKEYLSDSTKDKPIKIIINTNGGDLSAVMTIIDVIRISKLPVVTIGIGKCLSSGGLLLMAGHKRYLLPHSTVLIHDGSGATYGDTGKMLDSLEFTKKREETVREYILNSTSITPELYDSNYRRDWWIDSKEALELGIADKIITDISEMM